MLGRVLLFFAPGHLVKGKFMDKAKLIHAAGKVLIVSTLLRWYANRFRKASIVDTKDTTFDRS